jgi:outer membrane porin, OprD family
MLHAGYRFANSGFSLGASYLYSTPFDGCNDPAFSNQGGYCSKTYQDDTLPGAALNTLYEAYLRYQKNGWDAKIGDQVIDTPWAGPSDSRIKPNSFQGVDVSYALSPRWTIEAMDMIRYESRTNSSFSQSTLLTGYPLGGSGIPPNLASAYGPNSVATPGFLYGKIGYAGPPGLVANVYYYNFRDIANLFWADAKYTFASAPLKPFIALQGGAENNTGTSVLGTIDSQVFGAQAGVSLSKSLDATVGYDDIPSHSSTVPASSTQCNAKGQTTGYVPYLLGLNAPQCTYNGNGTETLDYGGLASPYSDGYATDPLFTRSTTQGLVDRLASGNAFQVMGTYTSTNKRFFAYVRRTWYNYGDAFIAQRSAETDYDATYYFNRPSKRYKGFMLRYRYGVRTLTNTAQVGGVPLFRFSRPQLEYAF